METSRCQTLSSPIPLYGNTISIGVTYPPASTPCRQFPYQDNITSISTNPIRNPDHHPHGIGGLIGITLSQVLQGYRNPTAMEACQQYERQMEMCAESKARNSIDPRMAEVAYTEQAKWADAQATRGDNAARLRAQQAKQNAHNCAIKQAGIVVPVQSEVDQHQKRVTTSEQEAQRQASTGADVKAAYERHLRVMQDTKQKAATGATIYAVNNPANVSIVHLGDGTSAQLQACQKPYQQMNPSHHTASHAQGSGSMQGHTGPLLTSKTSNTPSLIANVAGNAIAPGCSQYDAATTHADKFAVSISHLSSEPRLSKQPLQDHTLPSPATSSPDSYHSPTGMAKPASMSDGLYFPATPQSRKGSFEFQKTVVADEPNNRFCFTKQPKQFESKVPRLNGQPLQTREQPSIQVPAASSTVSPQTGSTALKPSKAAPLRHTSHATNLNEFSPQSETTMTVSQDNMAKKYIQDIEKRMCCMRAQIMAVEKEKRTKAASIEQHLSDLKQSSRKYLEQDVAVRQLVCLYESTLQELVKPIIAERARYQIVKENLIPPLAPQIWSSIANAAVHNFGFPDVRMGAKMGKLAKVSQSVQNIDPSLLSQEHQKVVSSHNVHPPTKGSEPSRPAPASVNKQQEFLRTQFAQQSEESRATGLSLQKVLQSPMPHIDTQRQLSRKRLAHDMSDQHRDSQTTLQGVKKVKTFKDGQTSIPVDLTRTADDVDAFPSMIGHTRFVKQDSTLRQPSNHPSVSRHLENVPLHLGDMPVFHPTSWSQESVSLPSSSQQETSYLVVAEKSDDGSLVSPRKRAVPPLDNAGIQAELQGALGISDTIGENVTTAFDADIGRAFKDIFGDVPDVFGTAPVMLEVSDEDLGLDFTWHDSQPDPM